MAKTKKPRKKRKTLPIKKIDKKKQETVIVTEYGVCCFCQGDCNPCSQACGRCVRNGLFWKAFENQEQSSQNPEEVLE